VLDDDQWRWAKMQIIHLASEYDGLASEYDGLASEYDVLASEYFISSFTLFLAHWCKGHALVTV
jgi:hypothetical protein